MPHNQAYLCAQLSVRPEPTTVDVSRPSSPCIHNFGISWRWAVSSVAFPASKEPPVPTGEETFIPLTLPVPVRNRTLIVQLKANHYTHWTPMHNHMRVCTGLLNHFPLPTLVLTGAQGFSITSHFQHLLFFQAHRAFESLLTSNTCCSYRRTGLLNHVSLPTLAISYGRTGLSNHFPIPHLLSPGFNPGTYRELIGSTINSIATFGELGLYESWPSD
jgi:hypothetical protein